MLLNYHRRHVVPRSPIDKDIDYKAINKPGFLEKVKTTHFVENSYLQIYDREGFNKIIFDQEALNQAQNHFDVSINPYPNAVRIWERYENKSLQEEYVVIGLKEVREGEIYQGYESHNGFKTRRRHQVAVLATGMNKTSLALITDLVWEGNGNFNEN